MWLGFIAAGAVAAFGWRGDWIAAGTAAVIVLVLVILWARREFTAAAAFLREVQQPEPPPVVPRPRGFDHPPWKTMEMPAIGHEADCPAMASMMPDGSAGRCRCGVRLP
jgi:hypothetical protein